MLSCFFLCTSNINRPIIILFSSFKHRCLLFSIRSWFVFSISKQQFVFSVIPYTYNHIHIYINIYKRQNADSIAFHLINAEKTYKIGINEQWRRPKLSNICKTENISTKTTTATERAWKKRTTNPRKRK